jgi:polar amino acid transport system substrate-binding protein
MKKLITFMIGGFILFSIGVNAAEIPLITIQLPPENFKQDNKIVGLSVDIIKAVMKRMGHTVSIKIYPFIRGRSMMQEGQAAGIFTIGKNAKRAKFLSYPKTPVTYVKLVFFKMKGRNITWKALEDLKDYTVGYAVDFDYGTLINEAVKTKMFRTIGVVGYEPTKRLIKLLLSGRCDLFIADLAAAEYIIKTQFPDDTGSIDFIPHPIPWHGGKAQIGHYLAFAKKWPGAEQLTRDFDKEMVKFSDSKEIKEIYAKWGLSLVNGALTLN